MPRLIGRRGRKMLWFDSGVRVAVAFFVCLPLGFVWGGVVGASGRVFGGGVQSRLSARSKINKAIELSPAGKKCWLKVRESTYARATAENQTIV